MSSTERHPATEQVLRWFDFDHLPPDLSVISERTALLAHDMTNELPDGPELTTGLRKLLEAKDCFVRAAVAARTENEEAGR